LVLLQSKIGLSEEDILASSLRSKLPFKEAIKTVRSKGYLLAKPHLLSAYDK